MKNLPNGYRYGYRDMHRNGYKYGNRFGIYPYTFLKI